LLVTAGRLYTTITGLESTTAGNGITPRKRGKHDNDRNWHTLTYDKDSNTVYCNGIAYPLKEHPSPLWRKDANKNTIGNYVEIV
jgi:hypothetical protein